MPYRGGAGTQSNPSVVLESSSTSSGHRRHTKGIDRFLLENQASLPGGVPFEVLPTIRLVIDSSRLGGAVVLGALCGVILLLFLRSWRAAFVAFASISDVIF